MASTWDNFVTTWDGLTTWDGSATISGTGVPIAGLGTLLVQIAYGADRTQDDALWPWVDVTPLVMYANQVSVSVGRADETSQATPASCGFSLLNTTGDHTPYNARSIYYPGVKRNTPVRVAFDPGDGGGYRVLFAGEAYSFTPAWDSTGVQPTIVVSAAGTLRRLTQGKRPVLSPLYRSTMALAPAALVNYWPMQDAATATAFAPGQVGLGGDLTASNITFAANSELPGSTALPVFTATSSMTGFFDPISSGTHWQLDWWQSMPEPTSDVTMIAFTASGTITQWKIIAGAGAVKVIGYDKTGAALVIRNSLPEDFFTGWRHLRLYVTQASGTVTWRFTWGNPSPSGTTWLIGGTYSGSVGTPLRSTISAADGLSGYTMGHLALFDAYDIAVPATAGNSYFNEQAGTRIARLCAESNIRIVMTGSAVGVMGPQPISDLVTLLRECEATDGGILYDGESTGGIGYICRTSRYNLAAAMILDMAAGDIGIPWAPVDDDQRNKNDVTVSSSGGSSATYVDETGPLGTAEIGDYSDSLVINRSVTEGLDWIAAWRVHLGTIEGLRYPALALNFRARPAQLLPWLAAPIASFRVDITNIDNTLSQAPPDDVSVIVEGYTQTIDTTSWTVSANCSPFGAWRVGVVASTDRVDSDRSTTHAGYTATAAAILVDGDLWTTTPADFPFDIGINGEQITVTGITGSTVPQTWAVTRSVNGVVKTIPANAAVSLWKPFVIAL